MNLLKQSTAVTVLVGPALDSTDGNTVEDALTISQADVRLSKNGGNMAQKNDATACTHDELGYYTCPLDATDTGTLGILKLMIHESGALPIWHEYLVVPANVYDALVSGSDYLQTDAVQISGDATAADNAELAFDGTGYGFTNCTIPTVTTLTGHTAQTGDTYALANGANGFAAIKGETASILEDTGTTLEGHLTGIKGAGWTDENLTTIDANVDAVLADTGTDGVVVAAASKTGYALSDAGADAVWDRTSGTLSLSFEVMLDRLYRFLMNKMNITDATGAVALRNEADGADIATQTISDDDTNTVRTALTWS